MTEDFEYGVVVHGKLMLIDYEHFLVCKRYGLETYRRPVGEWESA